MMKFLSQILLSLFLLSCVDVSALAPKNFVHSSHFSLGAFDDLDRGSDDLTPDNDRAARENPWIASEERERPESKADLRVKEIKMSDVLSYILIALGMLFVLGSLAQVVVANFIHLLLAGNQIAETIPAWTQMRTEMTFDQDISSPCRKWRSGRGLYRRRAL